MLYKERDNSIDITKGLLISSVVLHHYLLYSHSIMGIPNNVIDFLYDYQKVFLCFFMPGFFFVTGLVSNFEKPLKIFLANNFKSLIIPSFFFTLITRASEGVYNSLDWETVRSTIVDLLLFGGHFWFLQALFIAKILYYFISKIIKKSQLAVILCLCLALTGCVLNKLSLLPNFWFHQHAMDMMLFIATGVCLKPHINGPLLKWASFLFAGLITILLLTNAHVPYITRSFSMEIVEFPLHFILALSGSLFILKISQAIGRCSYLEYLGKASLVVYLSHIRFFIYPLLLLTIGWLSHASIIISFFIITAEIIVVLCCCMLVYHILSTKYLRWILGR